MGLRSKETLQKQQAKMKRELQGTTLPKRTGGLGEKDPVPDKLCATRGRGAKDLVSDKLRTLFTLKSPTLRAAKTQEITYARQCMMAVGKYMLHIKDMDLARIFYMHPASVARLLRAFADEHSSMKDYRAEILHDARAKAFMKEAQKKLKEVRKWLRRK